MQEQSQQIFDYIHQQLQQGVSEADIRQQLMAHGWVPEAVQAAFGAYYATMSKTTSSVPVPPATVAQSAGRRKLFIFALIAIVIIVASVAVTIAVIMLMRGKADAPKSSSMQTSATESLAAPALERNKDQTTRKQDAFVVSAAINEYIANHNGQMPQSVSATGPSTLNICGLSCDASASQAELNAYKPNKVQYKPYAANLMVPDAETMYIVNGAACNPDGTGISGTSTSRVYVILYGLQSGSSVQQRCVSS